MRYPSMYVKHVVGAAEELFPVLKIVSSAPGGPLLAYTAEQQAVELSDGMVYVMNETGHTIDRYALSGAQ